MTIEIKMTSFVQFETPRLVVRCLRDDDLDALVAYRSLPEVMRMQLWDSYDADKGRELIASTKNIEPFTPDTWFQFGVELKASGELIGDLYLKMDEAGKQAEIGYTFSPKFQRQGLATEAARGLVNHAFTAKGLHRIYGVTDPRHAASINLMKRLGMRQEAHFRESLWFKGEWADDVLFAILRREWDAMTSQE
jgi:RimJ/RimL family protein N-acetyltransferase